MTPTNDNSPGAVFTLDEAAAHLRLTNRGAAKIAKRHGLCMVAGRRAHGRLTISVSNRA